MNTDIKYIKKQYSRFGIAYLCGAVFSSAFVYAVIYIVSLLRGEWLQNVDMAVLVQMLPRFLIAYPVFISIVMLLPRMKIPEQKLGAGRFFKGFFMAYSTGIVGNVIALVVMAFFGVIKNLIFHDVSLPETMNVLDVLDIITGLNPFLQLLFVVIIGPFFEELIFRKLLIDRIYGYGEVPAVLLSGLMFGLYHGNFQQFTYATAIGCVFAYIYIRTGRLRYSALIHMMVNAIGSLLVGSVFKSLDIDEFIRSYMGSIQNGNMDAAIDRLSANAGSLMILILVELFIFAIILIGIVMWIVTLVKKQIFFVHYANEVPRGKKFSVAFLNLGVILYFLVYIVKIIIGMIVS